ncbi:glutaminase [Fluctibacter halophilus]|uniref:glutaminase n=1 Tax=Fluctibacter halophilus TaxID=226011 RepID=UPI003899088C
MEQDALQPLLDNLLVKHREHYVHGTVANYIPALGEVSPQLAGVAIAPLNGDVVGAGDWQTPFSIQSISKVFALVMAMQRIGDTLWQRVGMEPSGQAFNSIIQLEWEQGIPRNPVINAGALLVADVLVSHFSASQSAFSHFLRKLAQDEHVFADQRVLSSELEHGSRNAALAYLMKSFGNIHADVPAVLNHYFSQCAMTMTCQQLARSLLFLANRGVDPVTGEQICSAQDAHRVNAILSTSGMYDQSGEFAFSVGLPAKSGVGGGIVAIVPQQGVVCTWSPPLNAQGNSVVGMRLIADIAQALGLSIY